MTESIDPMGHMTTTLYDADGEVTESIDPLGHATTTLYDADGEVTESIDPLGHMTVQLAGLALLGLAMLRLDLGQASLAAPLWILGAMALLPLLQLAPLPPDVWQGLVIMAVLAVLAVVWAAREFARSVR